MTDHRLTARHLGDDRFAISIRGHEVLVDQPRENGGSDVAATPTELFVASLACCVAFYAQRYLARHGAPDSRLVVTASYTMADRPRRVQEMTIRIAAPAGLTPDERRALLAVASHCTVHNTLRRPPGVRIELDPGGEAVVAEPTEKTAAVSRA